MSTTVEESKNLGNKAFSEGNTKLALKHYSSGIEALAKESDNPLAHPHAAALYSNRSACYSKLSNFALAMSDAALAIAAKPSWWKAYLRAAVAAEGLGGGGGERDTAEAFLRKGLAIEPTNPELNEKLDKIMSARNPPRRHSKDEETSVSSQANSRSAKKNKSVGDKYKSPAFVDPLWRAKLSGDIPTRGSRKGMKLLYRPPTLDGAPMTEKGPMFFSSVPKWASDPSFYMAYLAGESVDGPVGPEMKMLAQLSASSWLSQREADVAYRKSNRVPAKCDFCEISLEGFGDDGPCCECGEQYCSRECLYKDMKNHQKTCATIRSQSEFVPRMHQAYWDAVCYGHVSWPGERVKNYSIQYAELRKQKGIAPTAERAVRPPKSEDDVKVDELSYLMKFERDAVTSTLSGLQNAMKSRDEIKAIAAQDTLFAAVLELYIRYANYDSRFDSPFRATFKWLMAQMSYENVMGPLGLQRFVEDFAVTEKRLSAGMDLLKNEKNGSQSLAANCSSMRLI